MANDQVDGHDEPAQPKNWRQRLYDWLWGEGTNLLPQEIIIAARRVTQEAENLEALVSALKRKIDDPTRR